MKVLARGTTQLFVRLRVWCAVWCAVAVAVAVHASRGAQSKRLVCAHCVLPWVCGAGLVTCAFAKGSGGALRRVVRRIRTHLLMNGLGHKSVGGAVHRRGVWSAHVLVEASVYGRKRIVARRVQRA